MPDATECWLVEYVDLDKRTVFDRFANVNEAIPCLHRVLANGQRPRLYRETPITLKIDVGGDAPVKATRKRRKTPSPADKPASDTPTGPGNGEAGELKGAAGPDAYRTPHSGKPLPDKAADRPVANPTSPVFDCEARLDSAPPCPGPIHYDTFTHGRFCSLHMPAIPIDGRMELHRKNHGRNRPVRVAHAL